MAQVTANGIKIEYDISGPSDGEPLVLIHGLGAQLIQWPDALCATFAAHGFRIIRFDNRDVGLSTHFDGVPIPDIPKVVAAQARGETADIPYSVSDMADDTVGLMSALGLETAHIFGISLGSYIAQTVAINHPTRVRSLTVVMSNTGNPASPPPDPKVLQTLATPLPDPSQDREGFMRQSIILGRAIGSPGYPMDDATLADFFLRAALRSYDPMGVGRQFAAARGALDRREGLRRLKVPTLVIHGTDDPLNPLPCGEEIARHVEGSFLLTIKGMGHDLPPQLCNTFAAATALNARR